ncbi:hypothetical protein RCO28_30840 [Streptomyces sp. LHD-70]|uniref:hypothetical protein n=1 Tax=Streptomyces sp. LHD-70 TaxID=3072140 RepID=UPI00280D5B5E|nr:hypothetical protein [Streptomyces sp. LHD-70]MDQ8706835.1 hypothetical protein [Streptomyces sp. LHD-70]
MMLLAAAAWGWFGYLMLAPWGPTDMSSTSELLCRGVLIEPLPGNNECHSDLRQWTPLLGILALAVITSVAASATTVYSMVLSRLARSDGPSIPSQS